MYIIVGLGNPGKKYEDTRHNIGFKTIDALADKLNIKVNKIKFKGLVGEGRIAGEKVILLKPHTFMNNSGESVVEILNFYKLKPENLLVVVDDIDIEFAQLKIKKNGSAGTHNGLKSIVNLIGSKDFARFKIGVGKKHPNEDLASFVLSNFPSRDKKHIEDAVDACSESIIKTVTDGIDVAMNFYNNNIY
ncbi:MAG: aminoacyl-tRNA hydrolase [Peptoniphilus rhinitidis]|uniref:aminoacyl-tRNA hydrolase n=1 Tax=Peptoniphilus rhinitidis TaxID=1175452 RepID=UPI0029028C72|nr:aminoacyl-tRNA hydrolase [Peptoniphilus rhinitidis]MDU2109658.1 aminoacyl-tRNA hydrolase [Peptoniphilus lacydonensis]MDU3751497.1 aminoacyl-tRNA hydrolase [Peptoniphilus rhinitidis]MDU5595360.1 aminoacyl-tRNA hydrolase [Peptoniphilus rhinitidis]